MSKKMAVCFVIFILLILCNGCGKSNRTETTGTKSDESAKKVIPVDNSIPDFSFALDGYVEIQPDKPDSIDVASYLPDEDMVLTFEQIYSEKLTKNKGLFLKKAVTVNDDKGVDYENTVIGSGVYSHENIYYDSSKDCLRRSYTDKLTGKEEIVACLIPLGKSLAMSGGALSDSGYLFTVSTGAGIHKDCVCQLEEIYHSDGSFFGARGHYFAKGVGEVLSVFQLGEDADFEVEEILAGIDKSEPSMPAGNDNVVFSENTENDDNDGSDPAMDTWNSVFYANWLQSDPPAGYICDNGSEAILRMIYDQENLVFEINGEPIALVEKVSANGNILKYMNEDSNFIVIYDENTNEIDIEDRYTGEDFSGHYTALAE